MSDRQVEGVEYTPEAVESVREMLIDVRDSALMASRFDVAAGLSHALVYLSHYRDALGNLDEAFRTIEGQT